jgi:glucose-6-phosphate 1-epimerase
MSTQYWQKRMEIPGRVSFSEGNGDLPRVEIKTAHSSGEVYLQGATVTHFQKNGEQPLLFLSQFSRWQMGQPIRGGVPVVFPWFGPREGSQQHGFARVNMWELKEITQMPDGSISLHFGLPPSADASLVTPFRADYVVTFGKQLTLELLVRNESADQEFAFENCLHTYFHVGDINAVSVTGLKGATYLDKVDNFARRQETEQHLKFTKETDRIYQDTTGTVEILDAKLQRRITVGKEGSRSTVVWNPWVAKAQQMPDFGDDEYLGMVCVESGNVADNRIVLPPRKSSILKVVIQSSPL